FENGCGALCQTPNAVAETLQRLFRDDAARWREWVANIARLSRPNAARDIARLVLGGVGNQQSVISNQYAPHDYSLLTSDF
ncbi:MAG: hypothetical protein M3463_18045, partial [Verrucomicrobiota bacterium]|nr:hypothetical protein [Verrucomicrobiota bacterium]